MKQFSARIPGIPVKRPFCGAFDLTWCEIRRLGYPAFGGKKADDIYSRGSDSLDPTVLEPGDLYTPYQVNSEVGANQLVQRFPYAESSKLYNSSYPGEQPLTKKVFWAK